MYRLYPMLKAKEYNVYKTFDYFSCKRAPSAQWSHDHGLLGKTLYTLFTETTGASQEVNL